MKLDKLVSKITYFPSNFYEVVLLHNRFLDFTKLFNYALVHWAQTFDLSSYCFVLKCQSQWIKYN